METNLNETMQQVIEVISTFGLDVVGAIVILIVGWIAAGWLSRALGRALSRASRVDETLRQFLTSVARYAVIVFTIIAVLERFGVETTSFIAVLAAAGLAIGLAFQGTLSNIAAGVMLQIFRPFKVGHYIDGGGVGGTVEMISLFATELNTPDNVHIIVPNAQLWGASIKNYSHNARRRLDIDVGIGYGDDIGRALDVIKGLADADERVDSDPAPEVMVTGLGDSAVDLQLRLWCAAGDYWGLRYDLTRSVKEAFDAAGISIPFPQRTVHLEKGGD